MHVAERGLFLGISRLIWGFDIEPAVDTNRVQIIPNPEKYTQGFLVMPASPEVFPYPPLPSPSAKLLNLMTIITFEAWRY